MLLGSINRDFEARFLLASSDRCKEVVQDHDLHRALEL